MAPYGCEGERGKSGPKQSFAISKCSQMNSPDYGPTHGRFHDTPSPLPNHNHHLSAARSIMTSKVYVGQYALCLWFFSQCRSVVHELATAALVPIRCFGALRTVSLTCISDVSSPSHVLCLRYPGLFSVLVVLPPMCL